MASLAFDLEFAEELDQQRARVGAKVGRLKGILAQSVIRGKQQAQRVRVTHPHAGFNGKVAGLVQRKVLQVAPAHAFAQL